MLKGLVHVIITIEELNSYFFKMVLLLPEGGLTVRPNDIIKEIDKLELSEKLILVEDIWDSIAMSNSSLPLPEWQKNELNNRYAEYKNGKLGLHDWKDVHSIIREKNQ